MTTRRRLFTIGETDIYLHLGTLLFAAYMVLTGHGGLLAVSFGSILLHEIAHGAVCWGFGKPPNEIEITPLGCLMRLEEESALSPGKRLMVLCAGPLASLALCWAALAATKLGWISGEAGRRLFCCNLLLVLGNLLPALPLDGGRILALVLSLRFRGETVQRVMRISGTVLGLACIGLNLMLSITHGGWNLSCAMAGCFLMYAAAVGTTSFALAELRRLIDRKTRLEARQTCPCKWLTVTPQTPLQKAVSLLPSAAYAMLAVVQPADMSLMAQVGEGTLIAAYLEQPGEKCRVLLSS